VLDALLSGRGWIGLVFVLLAGIVFFNVDLLQMNRQIASTAEHAGSIKRENARLRSEAARLGSTERIQAVAAESGLIMPAPGDVRYLRSRSPDGGHAARALAAGETSTPAPAVPETITDPAAIVPIDPATVPVEPAPVPVEPAPVAVEPVTDPSLVVAEP
jgi:cell division protein FtsL